MRTRFAALAATLALTACMEPMFSPIAGPPDEPPRATPVVVTGEVRIGEYRPDHGETVLRIYASAALHVLLDVVDVWDGEPYEVRIYPGDDPRPDICQWVVQAERWDGVLSDAVPLFVSPPDGCVFGRIRSFRGGRVDLPTYAPLEEPFRVEVAVHLDGEPLDPALGVFELTRRTADSAHVPTAVRPDSMGRITVETTDRAQWYSFCNGVRLTARHASVSRTSSLAPIPLDRCAGGRRLPDVRFGQKRAVEGRVTFGPTPTGTYGYIAGRPAGDGEVSLHLLRGEDSQAYGDTVTTHDDGSFHLWFPAGADDPGCDFLVEAKHGDGTRQILQAITPETCSGVPFVSFSFYEAAVG